MPSHRFNVASIVALCTALSLPGAAAATLAAPVATAMHGSLQEIVVTATRSEQPRLDVPLSISRLDGDELARVGAQHAYESLNRVAGVLIQRGSGQESLIAVRSPVLTGSGACGAFLILEDEMPVRPTGFCNVNELFEINTEQAGALEVIRGPAPVTYGANGLHGVVNVRSPSAAALQGLRIALESGAADWRRASFAVGNAHPGRSFGAYGIVSRDGGFRADSRVADAKLNLLYER